MPAMPEANPSLAAWSGTDLAALLSLETVGAMHYRNRFGDANRNGRSYGGQVLGQAMMAAALGVGEDRAASAMQFMFLQGAVPDQPIDFRVTVLQEGKRFSSRHVRATQDGGRIVLDAHASFSVPLPAPSHAVASAACEPAPDRLPGLPEVPAPWQERLRNLSGYAFDEKAAIDFRFADLAQVDPASAEPRLRYWLKARLPLPPAPTIQVAAFAYLSDWWLNFASLAPHVRELAGDERLYIASLNHCIWWHRPFRCDRWLHVASSSPGAHGGRGFALADVHDEAGVLVATMSQQSLMAHA